MDASNPQTPNLYADSRADITAMYGDRKNSPADYGDRGVVASASVVDRTVSVEQVPEPAEQPEQMSFINEAGEAEVPLSEREKVRLQIAEIRQRSAERAAEAKTIPMDAGGREYRAAAARTRARGVI